MKCFLICPKKSRIVACNLLHEIMNARNREYPKGLNNVPCVIWSCIKMHATHEIMNYALRFNYSCNKLHATHKIMNIRKGEITFCAWFGRASRCTLRMKS